MPIDMRDSVCAECASKMGWEKLDKVVGVWQGKCDFCCQNKPLTSLHNDWRKVNPLEKLSRELGMFADFNKDADRVNGYVLTKAKRVIEKLAEVADGHWENICDGPPAYICHTDDLRLQCWIGHCVDIAAGKEDK